MKLLNFILLVIMALSFNKLSSQNTQKIFFSVEAYNTGQEQFVIKNNLENVYIIGQNFFVDAGGLTFNKLLMEDFLNKLIPDKAKSGYAVLDWEGYAYDVLGWRPVTDQQYQTVLNTFIASIKYAKYLRPNIKWSFYGIPNHFYEQYTEGAVSTYVAKYMSFVKELDFLTPVLYLAYKGQTIEQDFTSQYINSNIRFSLELGSILNIPVYPFIWHRYDNASLISVSAFTDLLNRTLKTTNFGNKIGGILWWNCEAYLYQHRSEDAILTAEFKNVTNFDQYQETLFQNYLNSIRSLFGN